MQYLLIPKLDTHWTGFQTNAALSIPSVAHLQYPCIIHASPTASHPQRSGLSKMTREKKNQKPKKKYQHCHAALTSPASTSLARQVGLRP